MAERLGVFLFTGLNGKLVGQRTDGLATWLEPAGVRVVRLVDSSRRLFLCGSDAYPGRAALKAFLRAEMEGLDRTVFVGGSAGGWGALDYASALGASHVVGLSAITRFDADAAAHDPRGRHPGLGPRWWTLVPDDRRRNSARLLAARGYRGDVVLFHARHNAPDCFHAESLAHLPGVQRVPVPASRHAFFSEAGIDMADCLLRAAAQCGFVLPPHPRAPAPAGQRAGGGTGPGRRGGRHRRRHGFARETGSAQNPDLK